MSSYLKGASKLNKMKPDDAFNLKKRKHFAAITEDLGLPTPKHVCCEVTISSVCDSLCLGTVDTEHGELLDELEETQGSNSFPGESHSSSTEVIFDGSSFQKRGSRDEASTSGANSRSVTSGNSPLFLESRMPSAEDHDMEDAHISHQDNIGWHDVDNLEECLSTPYYKDCHQHTGEELEGFLSSSGANANMYTLSSERWIVDQEAEIARRKPTIDQEFEQYFSTLML